MLKAYVCTNCNEFHDEPKCSKCGEVVRVEVDTTNDVWIELVRHLGITRTCDIVVEDYKSGGNVLWNEYCKLAAKPTVAQARLYNIKNFFPNLLTKLRVKFYRGLLKCIDQLTK